MKRKEADTIKYRSERFNNNLSILCDVTGKYDIPPIAPEEYEPCEFIGFNYAKGCSDRGTTGVHFFIDDYQFERVWNQCEKYLDFLSEFKAVASPDYSMFTDWPYPVQMFNHYRKHYIANRLQARGVKVYPTISWSTESSYEFCFEGEPRGATVIVSSVGTQKNPGARKLFMQGYREMMRRLEPKVILFHGDVPDECQGNIVRMKAFQKKFARKGGEDDGT